MNPEQASTSKQATKTAPRRKLSNLAWRIITASIVGPVVLISAFIGDTVWFALMAFGAALGLLEFFNLTRLQAVSGNGLIGIVCGILFIGGVHFRWPALWIGAMIAAPVLTFIAVWIQKRPMSAVIGHALATLTGMVYIAVPFALVVEMRSRSEGFQWELVIFTITIATDTAAYFGGRFFGKRKLAPKLSPSKTIEGAIIGAVVGALLTMLVLALTNHLSVSTAIMALLGPPIAILGDLLESALKRYFHVKDSHMTGLNIFPGHGGVLDRVDSLLVVTPFVYLWLTLGGLI